MTSAQKWAIVAVMVIVLALPAVGLAMDAGTTGTPLADAAKLGSKDQRDNARIIEREVRAVGFDGRVVKAAIANAVRESGLNAAAIGDGGKAVGLFQIHPWGGTVEQRKDPIYNVRKMLQAEALANTSHGKAFRQVIELGGSAEDVAAAWCAELERPTDKAGESIKSRKLVKSLWPVDLV